MSSSNQSVLERLFNLNANQTNVRTEIMAGVTTFLAMCYIIIVRVRALIAAQRRRRWARHTVRCGTG